MKTPKTLKVKAIETLAPFVTIEGKLYKLKKGDVVRLPKTNADMLLTHGVAVLSKAKITTKPYAIPIPTTKRKSIKEYKLSKHEKWLLEGNYKILGKHKKAGKIEKNKNIYRFNASKRT